MQSLPTFGVEHRRAPAQATTPSSGRDWEELTWSWVGSNTRWKGPAVKSADNTVRWANATWGGNSLEKPWGLSCAWSQIFGVSNIYLAWSTETRGADTRFNIQVQPSSGPFGGKSIQCETPLPLTLVTATLSSAAEQSPTGTSASNSCPFTFHAVYRGEIPHQSADL